MHQNRYKWPGRGVLLRVNRGEQPLADKFNQLKPLLSKLRPENNHLGLDIAIDKAGADNRREAQVLWNSQDEQVWMYPDRFGYLQLAAG